MGSKSVHALLEDIRLLGTRQFELVEAVRQQVHHAFPEATEAVQYGGILCTTETRFCGVFAYKAHISVEFSRGALIEDEWGHLEGGGQFRRHLKLKQLADLETRRLADYLPLAHRAAMDED
jgi:hypothetical protein